MKLTEFVTGQKSLGHARVHEKQRQDNYVVCNPTQMPGTKLQLAADSGCGRTCIGITVSTCILLETHITMLNGRVVAVW